MQVIRQSAHDDPAASTSLRCEIPGSSAGLPYWAQPTAVSPSNTSAACACPVSTRPRLKSRESSAVRGTAPDPGAECVARWNHVHQQPPNPPPLCGSHSSTKAPHVSLLN